MAARAGAVVAMSKPISTDPGGAKSAADAMVENFSPSGWPKGRPFALWES